MKPRDSLKLVQPERGLQFRLSYDDELMFSQRTDWRLVPNRFSQALEEARASGKSILDLTASNPTRVGIEPDETAILNALYNRSSLDYEPQPKGLRSARLAVADYYREHGENIDPEGVVLTSGTSEGYSHVFRLLANAGEEVLVPKPSYPLFEFLAELADIKLVPYLLIYDHGWQIDLASLLDVVSDRVRALVVVNPNNPTGSYVRADERERLNRFCGERGLALVADEVFLDYSLDRSPQLSFAANDHALTFTLSGLSKISALPQMKLAWIAVNGPNPMRQRALERLEVIADTYLSVSAPIQWAARAFLEQRKMIQPRLNARLRANLAELDLQLARQQICVRLALQGGWYVVLRVPVTRPDEELAIQLLRSCSVLVHPGHFYDFPQDGYLVISLIAPEKDFRVAMERLLTFLDVESRQ
jgi:alanine-synthesizing transaminase